MGNIGAHATPYPINLGSGDQAVASKSADAVAHALRRGGEIGARGVVVHTGSAAGWDMGSDLGLAAGRALGQIGEIVLPLLDKLGDDDPDLLFEPMAGQGQMLCELADVPFVVETPGGKAGHARDIATLKGLRAA